MQLQWITDLLSAATCEINNAMSLSRTGSINWCNPRIQRLKIHGKPKHIQIKQDVLNLSLSRTGRAEPVSCLIFRYIIIVTSVLQKRRYKMNVATCDSPELSQRLKPLLMTSMISTERKVKETHLWWTIWCRSKTCILNTPLTDLSPGKLNTCI